MTSHIFVGPPLHPTYFVIGRKGSGKSSLLERALEYYYRTHSYVICDWASAFDLECLHWAVPNPKLPKDQQTAYPILLIIPRSTEIIANGRQIKTPTGEIVEAVKTVHDDVPLAKIFKQAYEERRICVFSIYFYQDPRKGQYKFGVMLRDMMIVMRDHLPSHINVALGLREIADLAAARMLTHGKGGETESKRSLLFFSRQARHARCTIIADVQNPDDVYQNLTAQEDYILVKRMNKHHYPEKLGWFIREIEDKRDFAKRHYMSKKLKVISLDHISRNSFYCVYPDGNWSLEHNHEPTFKHHEVDDDAKALAGISLKFLAKTDLVKDATVELQQKVEKQNEAKQKLQTAMECYRLNKTEGIIYDDLAKKVGWMGEDGKPSGQALLVYIQRKIKKGLIQPIE